MLALYSFRVTNDSLFFSLKCFIIVSSVPDLIPTKHASIVFVDRDILSIEKNLSAPVQNETLRVDINISVVNMSLSLCNLKSMLPAMHAEHRPVLDHGVIKTTLDRRSWSLTGINRLDLLIPLINDTTLRHQITTPHSFPALSSFNVFFSHFVSLD